MSLLTSLSAEAVRLAEEHFTVKETTPDQFRQLQYPKFLPVMRFTIRRCRAEGFGSLMTMDTVAMGGMMKLSTLVFTPGEGGRVPFLLIDTMEMIGRAIFPLALMLLGANLSEKLPEGVQIYLIQ